ncbi:MAG: branched-chain amino acid ABC transporter permease [Dehalococcoidia bacterium]
MEGIFPYIGTVLIMVGIYALFGLGLNVQWGFAGLINIGHVAFMAIGAYTMVILNLEGVPLALAVLIGLALAGGIGALLTVPAIRLKADYLAIVTVGFSEIVRYVALNERWLTGGAAGLVGFDIPLRGVVSAGQYNLFLLGLVWGTVVIAFLLLQRLVKSPWGRALKSIREDEDVARVLGKNVSGYKMQAFLLGSVLAGLAGMMLAFYHQYIGPSYYYPMETFYAWVIVILGGSANNLGTLVGALLLWGFLTGTRFLAPLVPLTAYTFSALRMMLVGLLLIVLMIYRPQGILGNKKELTF